MKQEVLKGIREGWPVILGFIPMGIAFGLLVTQMGFAWFWAPIFSAVIYAGSMEFLALGLVTAGTGWVPDLVTGFLVNFRHVFYGLTYPRQRIHSPIGRAYVTYALTDEVYAITSKYGANGLENGQPVSGPHLVALSASTQFSWVFSSFLGAVAGSAVTIPWKGLDFALTALFIVLAVDALRSNRDFSLVLTAVVLGLFGTVVFPNQMLIVALLAYVGVLLARYYSPRLDQTMRWRPYGTA